MVETPRISMIVTAYDEAGRIEKAIGSVLGDLTDGEVVVVDDGSTDDTAGVVRSMGDPRVRVIEGGRLGRAGALKLAVEASRGRYVANLDADDEAMPGRLTAQAGFLDTHPAVAWVGGAEEMIDSVRGERFVRRYPTDDAAIRRLAAKCVPYSHSAVMFRRSLLNEGLNYDPAQPYLIDFEFFLRVAARHQVANLPQTVVRRHVRAESFFQSRFSTARQNRRLARLCSHAVGLFGLPPRYHVYPLARLAYPLLPNVLKRTIRATHGMKETEIGAGD